ncbi:MAG: DUF1501 domain-containing protein [Pirellulales bacterium]
MMYTPCDSLFTRRRWLQVGGLAASAVAAPGWSRAAGGQVRPGGKARSCILIYLLGGPPHQDMFDLKPHAPAEIRGPFQPIGTSVAGLQICQHLPRLAALADRYALVRSISHQNNNHTPMIYYTLTGRPVELPAVDNDVSPPSPRDFPHVGSIVARFKPGSSELPAFISMPECAVRSNEDNIRAATPLRGGRAGLLGAAFDPLLVNGDPRQPDAVPQMSLPEDVPRERFQRRRALLAAIESRRPDQLAQSGFEALRETAVHLTGVAGETGLHSLENEPAETRDLYGRHRFGQSLLLARRFVEAGVPTVAIHFNHMTHCDGWDTHAKNFEALEKELLPLVDEGVSGLLTDLHRRGLLDETVVMMYGEFGRTPKINANAGRDHWGACSSALLAGGGIQGGRVIGGSDRDAAWPASQPHDPVDLHATMYHCLGLSPELTLHDQLNRPLAICTGRAIAGLL